MLITNFSFKFPNVQTLCPGGIAVCQGGLTGLGPQEQHPESHRKNLRTKTMVGSLTPYGNLFLLARFHYHARGKACSVAKLLPASMAKQ